MELQKIQDEGRFFPVLDAAGNLTDFEVKIAGPDAAVQAKAQNEITSRISKARAVGIETSEEAFREMALDRLVATVLDWKNLEYKGEPLECNPVNVRRMLSDYPVFHQQVTYFSSERALYQPAAETSEHEAEVAA
jgi:hypothetical protein